MLAPWNKSCDSLDSVLKKGHHFSDRSPYSQNYGFSSCHEQMWELDIRRLSTKELMLLDCGALIDSWESFGQQGDQTLNPKGNQSWIFIGRTDAEAEGPVLWPPDS